MPKPETEIRARRTYENPCGSVYNYMEFLANDPVMLAGDLTLQYYENPNSLRPIVEVDRQRKTAIETSYFSIKEMLWML